MPNAPATILLLFKRSPTVGFLGRTATESVSSSIALILSSESGVTCSAVGCSIEAKRGGKTKSAIVTAIFIGLNM